MEEKKRMFKLRNGAVIECLTEDLAWARFVGEFQDPKRKNYLFADGEDICLWFNPDETVLPEGGAFGPDYDVVEELFDEGGEG